MKDFRKKCVVALVSLLAVGATRGVKAVNIDFDGAVETAKSSSTPVKTSQADEAKITSEDSQAKDDSQANQTQKPEAKNSANKSTKETAAEKGAAGDGTTEENPDGEEDEIKEEDAKNNTDEKDKKGDGETDDGSGSDEKVAENQEPLVKPSARKSRVKLSSLTSEEEKTSMTLREKIRRIDDVIEGFSDDGTLDGVVMMEPTKARLEEKLKLDSLPLDKDDVVKINEYLDSSVEVETYNDNDEPILPKGNRGKRTVFGTTWACLERLKSVKERLLRERYQQLGIADDVKKQQEYAKQGYPEPESGKKAFDKDAFARFLEDANVKFKRELQTLLEYQPSHFERIVEVLRTVSRDNVTEEELKVAVDRIKLILKEVWTEKKVDELLPNMEVFRDFVVVVAKLADDVEKKNAEAEKKDATPGTEGQQAVSEQKRKQLKRQRKILAQAADVIIKNTELKNGVYGGYGLDALRNLLDIDFSNASTALVTDLENATLAQNKASLAYAAANAVKFFYNVLDEKDIVFDVRAYKDLEVVGENLQVMYTQGALRTFEQYLRTAFADQGTIGSSKFNSQERNRQLKLFYNNVKAKADTLSNLVNASWSVFSKTEAEGSRILSWWILAKQPVVKELLQTASASATYYDSLNLNAFSAGNSENALKNLVNAISQWFGALESNVALSRSEDYMIKALNMNRDALYNMSILVDALYKPFSLLLKSVKNITPADVDGLDWLNYQSKVYVKNLLSAGPALASDVSLLELVSLHLQNQFTVIRLITNFGDVNFTAGGSKTLVQSANLINPKAGPGTATVEDYFATDANDLAKGFLVSEPIYGLRPVWLGVKPAVNASANAAASTDITTKGIPAIPLASSSIAGREFGRMVAESMQSSEAKVKNAWQDSIGTGATFGAAFAGYQKTYFKFTNGSNAAVAPVGLTELAKADSNQPDKFVNILDYALTVAAGADGTKAGLLGADGLLAKAANDATKTVNADSANTAQLALWSIFKKSDYKYFPTDLELISGLVADSMNAIVSGKNGGILQRLGAGAQYSALNANNETVSTKYGFGLGGYLTNVALSTDVEKKAAFRGGLANGAAYTEQDYTPAAPPVQQPQPAAPDFSRYSLEQLQQWQKQLEDEAKKRGTLPGGAPSPYYNPGTPFRS